MMEKDLPQRQARAIRRSVRKKYAAVSRKPGGHFPYPVGRRSALKLGYARPWIDAAPRPAVDRFVGVGNPFLLRRPRPGDRVLDAGCGAGMDAFVAAGLVGPAGRVVGIDLTAEMLAPARRALAASGPGNLTFRRASVEKLPFPDRSFDLVVTNGVLNLVPDKDAAYGEIRRVLRPGGILAAADLLVVNAVPEEILSDMDAWSG